MVGKPSIHAEVLQQDWQDKIRRSTMARMPFSFKSSPTPLPVKPPPAPPLPAFLQASIASMICTHRFHRVFFAAHCYLTESVYEVVLQ